MKAPPPEVFKAYDIRGLYGDELDGDGAFQIGRAFVRLIAERDERPPSELEIGLARDMRLTAPEMASRFAEGAAAEGARVLDAGMAPTEALYFLVGDRGLAGGAAVTASHNPKPYTGVKLVGDGALPLSGDRGIGELRDAIATGFGPPPGGGEIDSIEVMDDYRARVTSMIDTARIAPMKLVVDGGNGMAGPMIGPILESLPLELVELYFTPDGNFPDHEPNPLLEENRRLVCDRVRAEGAALGIAWDGDADRCFFIDENGEFVDGDFLCALLGQELVQRSGGGEVLYDVRASRAVRDMVEAAGGTATVNRVGHAFFKARMRERDAIFGGEVSGHYYFHDFFCADSGAIPALLMLELLSVRGQTLGELVAPLRSRYFISGEINSEVDDVDAKLAEIEAAYGDAEISHLDGLSVDYPDWHFNVRPSNTEPLLRLNLESLVSAEDMEARRDAVLGMIRS